MSERRGRRDGVRLGFAALVFAACAVCPAFTAEGVYQTPPVLYVGDRGTLVYPLDALSVLSEDGLVSPDGLPKTDDVIIHKITVDRRGRRAIIEFQAFRTGAVPLPDIPIGANELRGLHVNIASILDAENVPVMLFPEAGLLSAPGTLWVMAALAAIAVIVLAITVLLYAKGGAFFENTLGVLRARFLLRRINSRLRRLEKRLRLGQITEREALSALSAEIRAFLSRFWRLPCYALSAEEFLWLEIPPCRPSGVPNGCVEPLPALCGFFKRCDGIRFGGARLTPQAVNAVRAEAEAIINGGAFAYSPAVRARAASPPC
jgi:hypothetical protein